MKKLFSFAVMGVAMLAACIAYAVPAGAADRMHDPGLYSVSVSTPDQSPMYSIAQDAVLAADAVTVIAANEVGRSTDGFQPDFGKSVGSHDSSFIDLRLRC